jgi:hypothetical protein
VAESDRCRPMHAQERPLASAVGFATIDSITAGHLELT